MQHYSDPQTLEQTLFRVPSLASPSRRIDHRSKSKQTDRDRLTGFNQQYSEFYRVIGAASLPASGRGQETISTDVSGAPRQIESSFATMSDINQAGRSSAMKPLSYTSHTAQGQRPRGRTGSNSSASSAASAASTKSHDQFVFSPHQTPACEKEPFFSHQEYSSDYHPRTRSECDPYSFTCLITTIIAQRLVSIPIWGQGTLVWRALRQNRRYCHYNYKRRYPDGFQVVALRIIGPTLLAPSYNCRGVGLRPTTFMACVVAAQRV